MATDVLQGSGYDFSRSAIALYIQLAELFRRRIDTGVWAVGSQIPTVEQLAMECGVARATIRQALDILEQDQLIERFRAKGTFVKRRAQEELWCVIPTDWSGLLQPSTDDATIELLSRRARSIPFPIGHQIGELWPAYQHFRRRHWRANRPFLVVDLYIADKVRKAISRKDLVTKTALRMASDVLGSDIGHARHVMTIGSADLVIANQLQIPVNAPVAYVRREVMDKAGTLVVVSDGTYRGDVVRVDVKLR